MNLTCPSCDTIFRIDPDHIGFAGRRVRCGSCGHEWDQARPEPEAEPEVEPGAEAAPEAPYAESAPIPEMRPTAADHAARRSGARQERPPQEASSTFQFWGIAALGVPTLPEDAA